MTSTSRRRLEVEEEDFELPCAWLHSQEDWGRVLCGLPRPGNLSALRCYFRQKHLEGTSAGLWEPRRAHARQGPGPTCCSPTYSTDLPKAGRQSVAEAPISSASLAHEAQDTQARSAFKEPSRFQRKNALRVRKQPSHAKVLNTIESAMPLCTFGSVEPPARRTIAHRYAHT